MASNYHSRKALHDLYDAKNSMREAINKLLKDLSITDKVDLYASRGMKVEITMLYKQLSGEDLSTAKARIDSCRGEQEMKDLFKGLEGIPGIA